MSLTIHMRQLESKETVCRPAVTSPAAFARADAGERRDHAGETIAKYLASEHHTVDALSVRYESATRTIVVGGIALDHTTRDHVLARCRRIGGVAHVTNLLTIAAPVSLEAQYQLLKETAEFAPKRRL